MATTLTPNARCRCDYAQTGVEHRGQDCVRYLRNEVRRLDRALVQARQERDENDASYCIMRDEVERLRPQLRAAEAERDAERARRERLEQRADDLAAAGRSLILVHQHPTARQLVDGVCLCHPCVTMRKLLAEEHHG